ncbi:MAG: MopE-related protein [Myxococcota bacterium]|nr:MopE-related protein [Myxococcota bacterium]
MIFILVTAFQMACIQDLTRSPTDFPDNPRDDYDQDGLSEFDGDCDDLNANILGPSLWYVDDDRDGFGDPSTEVEACASELRESTQIYVADGTDCDDSNSLVYPGFNNEVGQVCVLDLDGDGFGQPDAPAPYDSGTDCDDTNPNVHPDMQEICDGLDNNCSGEIDDYSGENAPLWYGDSDGDGYGDPEVTTHACEAPPLYVDNAFDCDDSNPSIRPNAPEVCNDGDLDGDGFDDAIDNNCNGVADENSALDVVVWFADADNDGFGSPSSVVYACELPEGHVDNPDDCNDNNMSVFPGAEEICNGLDDDCDTEFDEGSPTFSPTWYLDSDGDGFGDANVSQQSCYVPSGYVGNFSDCDDSVAEIYPNAPEYCDNIDNDCDGSIDDNAVDSSVFYIDNDGDGRGEPSQTLISCSTILPSGYSAYDDDCDDSDPNRAPNLPELCTDTVDENCDGDTTFAAVDLQTFYADSDADGYGNASLSIDFCSPPPGYVDNGDDCNDTDSDVQPFMPEDAELCNGKVDRCENLSLESLGEVDLDGDGYVACELDVDPLLWEDSSIIPLGGGDCDDGNADRYPGATELCNGIFEDCANVNYDFQPAPDLEMDDDGDGFVECTYYASVWASSTVVSGGDDCDDSSDLTYVGAAANYPNLCAQDADFDGEPDCNLTGISQDYSCDYGVIYPAGDGPDFRFIPAGVDPLGRYELTRDFYIMTTEVTVGMKETVMGGTDVYNQLPNDFWQIYAARQFANQLSVDTGFEPCYESDGWSVKPAYLYDIAACPGYRLATDAEWEYAARSGTTSDFWTGSGPESGGTTAEQGCDYDTIIIDGNLNPYLRDYAWFCGNTNVYQPVAQLQPNGFGLYDVHGNITEFVNDDWSSQFPTGNFQNPNGGNGGGNIARTTGAGSNGWVVQVPTALVVGGRTAGCCGHGSRLARTVF